jgi:hypothetical protein
MTEAVKTDKMGRRFGTVPAYEVVRRNVCGRVFRNEHPTHGPWYSTTIIRRYRDAAGNLQKATTFGADDLLVLAAVAEECWRFVTAQPAGPAGGDPPPDPPADPPGREAGGC